MFNWNLLLYFLIHTYIKYMYMFITAVFLRNFRSLHIFSLALYYIRIIHCHAQKGGLNIF